MGEGLGPELCEFAGGYLLHRSPLSVGGSAAQRRPAGKPHRSSAIMKNKSRLDP